MRIGELSRLTGVSARSIRHYEQKGLLKAERRENNYRQFDPSAVKRTKAIQLYLKLGLTTDEIRELFECQVAPPMITPIVKSWLPYTSRSCKE